MSNAMVEDARQIQAVGYSNVAACAFLVWELCITFSDEIDFMRSKTRSWPMKWAYLLLRYYTLVVALFTQSDGTGLCERFRLCVPPRCLTWYIYRTASLQIIIALQQFIMASRVYALYGRSRKIALVMAATLTMEHALIGSFTILTFSRVAYHDDVCIVIHMSHTAIGIGLPPILCDFFLLILTVYKCIQIVPRGSWHRTPVVRILVHDGSWAFIIVFGVFCLDGLFFFAFRGPLTTVASAWQFAASSFAACRIVLHMHREAVNPSSYDAILRSSTYIGDSGPHLRNRDRTAVGSEGFALTTFLPGVEFEESEPPDALAGAA